MASTLTAYYKQLIAEQKCLAKFLVGSGCCIICFNANPLLLDEHHLFGRANSEIILTVCSNHHALLTRMQGSWPREWLSGISGYKAENALADRAIADLVKVNADYLRGLDGCNHA